MPLDDFDEIAALTIEVSLLTSRIKEERDARQRGNRLVILAVVVLLALSGVLANSIQDIRQNRAEARVATCVASNETTHSINRILLIASKPKPGVTRTAADQARVDREIGVLLLPDRDCTAAGIRSYYEKKEAK